MRLRSPTPADPADGQAAHQARRDLVRARTLIWFWGIPAALLIGANSAYLQHALSFVAAGTLMTTATAWIGIACFINGRRCGRTHCVIDGYLLSLLTVVGVLNLLRVISLTWSSYLSIFLVMIIIGFAPECCGLKYLGARAPGRAKESRR